MAAKKKENKTIQNVKKIKKEIIPHTEGKFHSGSFFKKFWIPSVLLILLSFGLYSACLPFDYVLDDKIVISENQFTKKGFGGMWKILTTESFEGYFGEQRNLVEGSRYRPLSIMSFAAEYGVIGELNPKISHIINILLYGLTGILLMMVLSMMFRNSKSKWWWSIPFLAALIFIVHPIHVEAVANIKGRDEIMAMIFSLMALYGSLRYMDDKKLLWNIFLGFSFFLGLLSKENAITFLAVIPMTIYFFGKFDFSKVKNIFISLGISTVLYIIFRMTSVGALNLNQQITDLMNNPFYGMNPIEKMGTIMYTLGKYIVLMFWPHPLSHDYYPYAIPKSSLFSLIPLLSLVGYGLLAWIGYKGWKKKSIYAYSILFYFATLSIVSNIFFNVGTFMNERFIFMASAGFCIALTWFITEHLPRLLKFGQVLGIVLAVIILSGFSYKTLDRVPVWKDAISLNESAVKAYPNSARANSFMSTALFERFRGTLMPNTTKTLNSEQKNLLDWSEVYANRSVDIYPEYQYPNLMLVGIASERYKADRDIKHYINTIRPVILRRPDIPFIKEFNDYLKNQNHGNELFPFYLECGRELLKMRDKRRSFAIQYLNFAYEINPNDKGVVNELANAYELLGDIGGAETFRNKARILQ